MTTTQTIPTGLTELKHTHRRIWASGSYAAVAERIVDAVPPAHLLDRVPVGPGMRVLDLAAGTGNVAVRAAQRGADVTALDLTPELFERGRERAAQAGVEVTFVEGDAEDLPFEDGTFDAVLSTFGIQFAPASRGGRRRGGPRHAARRDDRPRQLDAAEPHRAGPEDGRLTAAQAAGVRLAPATVGRRGARA